MSEYLVSITYCGVDAFGLHVLFMCDRSTLMQYILVHICGVSGYVVRIYWICIVMSPYSGRHAGMGQCLLQEN